MKGEPDTPRYGVPPTVSAVVMLAISGDSKGAYAR